jgi:probable HAF family extracellular repeat protein
MPAPVNLISIDQLTIQGAIQLTANGINDKGQVVGQFTDGAGLAHGFMYEEEGYCRIDYPDPNATGTNIIGINNLGQMVGMINLPTGTFGFLYDRGAFSPPMQYPGSTTTVFNAINDRGEIVGVFQHGGLLYKAQRFGALTYPGALETTAEDMNENGQIVGNFVDAKGTHGFVYLENAGIFTRPLDYPRAAATVLRGINNEGQIVGGYLDATGHEHPFVSLAAELHPIAIPGVISGSINAISNRGQIVGNFIGPNGPQSFIAVLPT